MKKLVSLSLLLIPSSLIYAGPILPTFENAKSFSEFERSELFQSMEKGDNPRLWEVIFGTSVLKDLEGPRILISGSRISDRFSVPKHGIKSDLSNTTDDHVGYNPKMNTIIASRHKWGNCRSVTVNVCKYLDDGRFKTNASARPHDSGLILDLDEDPAIVALLKQKIAEFEKTLDGSEKE